MTADRHTWSAAAIGRLASGDIADFGSHLRLVLSLHRTHEAERNRLDGNVTHYRETFQISSDKALTGDAWKEILKVASLHERDGWADSFRYLIPDHLDETEKDFEMEGEREGEREKERERAREREKRLSLSKGEILRYIFGSNDSIFAKGRAEEFGVTMGRLELVTHSHIARVMKRLTSKGEEEELSKFLNGILKFIDTESAERWGGGILLRRSFFFITLSARPFALSSSHLCFPIHSLRHANLTAAVRLHSVAKL